MKNFRFLVSYDGTKYDGWQRQGNTDRTIQGKIEAVLHRLFDVSVETHGSGRTDAGVHARGQVANFWVEESVVEKAMAKLHRSRESRGNAWQCAQIQSYLNEYLPEDICVRELTVVPERFHSRLSAVGKTYCYRIHTSLLKPVFDRKYVWWLPEILDVDAMRQAAGLLVGTHDFMSFCGNPKMKKSTVRTINTLEILEDDQGLTIRVHGDGFLQNMVRILTGTLVEVGRGNIAPQTIQGILDARKRAVAGPMAPAQGLCLESVDYLQGKSDLL
ncbi:MAG: tRNA pseudouridine(38-40) synthase TruA [Lachnospiraceae bacterium]|nr:tRNA pseudouridine(38-40) synthase TruA [Lachnospiraceae bacterium]